ncbi:hypothetical protein [Priestia megaterium]|uniref:hypothetical protein n=1 Tax=Priestia megaterium TaxID=1404 RepID=UPI00207A0823|nr:hypothetical protein [Priestia megaterium]USL39838.1 hypothetical protein LIT34_32030 [Priestia megaterium]
MKRKESDWISLLTDYELDLLKKLILSDYKIKNLSKLTQHSYMFLKKELTEIRYKVKKDAKNSSDFKDYLDFLVKQDILIPTIAEVIYQKHKEIKGETINV